MIKAALCGCVIGAIIGGILALAIIGVFCLAGMGGL